MTMLPTMFRPTTTPKLARAVVRIMGWATVSVVLLVGLVLGVPGVRAQTASTNLPVVIADFNNDGIPDALVPTDNSPGATIAFGSVPYGTFSSAKEVAFPSACTGLFPDLSVGQILTGDFNGDGFVDLFFFCGSSATGVMLGNGDGTFGSPVLLTGLGSAKAATVGDFNHDGKLDLVLLGTSDAPGSGLLLYPGNGDGTFGQVTYSQFGSNTTFSPSQTFLGLIGIDVNGDGYPDIVLNGVTDGAQTISVFGNNKDGTFGLAAQATKLPNTTAALGTTSTALAYTIRTGNIYGSGNPDLVFSASPGALVLKNTSTATTYSFAAVTSISFPGSKGIALGGFTGNGFSDIAVANGTSIAVYSNDGTGNFTANYSALSTPSTSGLLSSADANLDGYADIYTAAQGTAGLQLSVALVNGSATATTQPFSLAIGTRATSATWAGNVLFTGATANGTQMVIGSPSVTMIASSENPSNIGDSVTFTAVVRASVTSSVVPTGLVYFTDGTVTLGSMAVDATGTATLTTSTLASGTHTIVAQYAGDSYYAASLSSTLSQVVTHAAKIVPVLTWPAPAPIPYGTPLSGTQLDATATSPTGATVAGTFVYVPAAGTVLSAGMQTLNVTFTPADTTTYATATASAPLTVLAASTGTTLALTSGGTSVSTVAAGSVVTLTASVTAGTALVTVGQVKFCDATATFCSDIHLLGTAQLTSSGTAVLRYIPGAGARSYKAVFVGTGNDAGSASTVSGLAVTSSLPTTTTIAQSGTVGNYSLTATVAGAGGATSPSGTVTFHNTSNGSASVGSATLGTPTVSLGLKTSSTPSSGIEPESTATADFNGDGIPDIVTLNPSEFHGVTGTGTLTVLLGKGDGTFVPAASPSTPGADLGLAVADFNGDGKADIAVLTDNNTVTVLLGNGDGTFRTAPASSGVSGFPGYVLAGDFNGDGKTDLAVTSYPNSTSASVITILLGNGDGTFTAGQPLANSPGGLLQAVGDFNQDGKLDLVSVNETTVSILLGNGDGTFTLSATLPITAGSFGGASVADFNGDGKQDLVLSSTDTNSHLLLTLYTGNGDGTFTAGATTSTSDTTYSYSFGAADFNGDGRPDLAVSDNAFTRILLNNGDGTFSSAASAAVQDTGGPDYLTSVVADFNGDGVPDIASANSDLNSVTVLLTQRSATTIATATGVNPVGAGPQAIVASYPGDGVFASSVSSSTTLTGSTQTPILTWTPAVPSIVYGTPLGPQQLNATAIGVGGAMLSGTFVYTPAAGTVLGAGVQTLSVVFTPSSTQYIPVKGSVSITVTKASPTVTWATPASIAYGIPLSSTQLDATFAGAGNTALAGVATYSPSAGSVLTPGTKTLSVSFAPTDSADYTGASGSVNLVVTSVTLTSLSPSAVPLGSATTTVTLTGSGFVTSSVVQVNGTAVATTYVSPTTLTAVIPAANFLKAGALALTVSDPSISAVSAAQSLTVVPANPAITLSGPGVTAPGSQPTVSLVITNPYPLDLTVTFTLAFSGASNPPVDDPAIQFASGGRTLTFVVPANSTAVPPIQLQAGTVAGTITIPLVLTAGGVNVTPAGLAPVVIVIPGTVPTISTSTLTRSGTTLSLVMHGFSNTREVTMATFHFVAAPGATVSTPDLIAPVGTVFAGWFGSAASAQFGSTFTYTQVFDVSDDAANIGSIQVTLTNGVGTSALQAAQ